MKKSFLVYLVLLAICTTYAKTIFVNSRKPNSLQKAVKKARPGDIVVVTSGIYKTSTLYPKSGITLLAKFGPVKTKIFVQNKQAIWIKNAKNITIQGFDIYSQADVGKPTNALVYIEKSQNIAIKDCFIHDAPKDADVVKINSSQDILIENSCLWNPARRIKKNSTFQECIDIRGFGDRRITIRGCWLFHQGQKGDYLVYAKGGTKDLLWENNIFGPSAGKGWGNVPVETGHLVKTDHTPYESENFVVRNNLFVNLRGSAAFAFAGPKIAFLYNNVFYKNHFAKKGIIEITPNKGTKGGPAKEIYCLNNIFYDNGKTKIYRVRDKKSGQNLVRAHNIYYPKVKGGDLNLKKEPGSLYNTNPKFLAPQIPKFDSRKSPKQINKYLKRFKLRKNSPARRRGVNVLRYKKNIHPNAIKQMQKGYDAFGRSRPKKAKWSIGLHQN